MEITITLKLRPVTPDLAALSDQEISDKLADEYEHAEGAGYFSCAGFMGGVHEVKVDRTETPTYEEDSP